MADEPNNAQEWTVDDVRAALVAVVANDWAVTLLYRRGGQERPEDVVGCTARVDGKLALTWREWTNQAGVRGYSVRSSCTLGDESAVLDVETARPPAPPTMAKFLRELQRVVSVADGGAAWRAWRKSNC